MITLYELIKKTSQEKGRPLKIIADWDEVLKPMRPWLLYNKTNAEIPFSDFFVRFWRKMEMVKFREKGIKHSIPEMVDAVRQNKEFSFCKSTFCPSCEILKKDMRMTDTEFYEKSPWISPAEDILTALKEGLVSEFIGLTCYRKSSKYPPGGDPRKTKAFQKTFGKFPNAKFFQTELQNPVGMVSQGETSPRRWDWIKENHPDFDIFVEDDIRNVQRTHALFPRKTYALPDYKTCRFKGPNNIYWVKTTISDLKDEDFVKAAEEYKKNQAAKEKAAQEQKNEQISERERERERESTIWKQPTLYWVLAGLTWITFLLIAFRRKKSLSEK